MAKKSAPFFPQQSQQSNSLLEGYSEFEDFIRTPGNTSKSAKSKKEGWQKVADQIKCRGVTTRFIAYYSKLGLCFFHTFIFSFIIFNVI